jgi:hypothetical protein
MSAIIKSSNVRLDDSDPSGSPAPAVPNARPAAAAAAHEKRVELLRVAERVHALELTCSCGEVTVVELDYPGRDEDREGPHA